MNQLSRWWADDYVDDLEEDALDDDFPWIDEVEDGELHEDGEYALDLDDDDDDWDEPEPSAEYDDDIRESLHPVNYDLSDISLALRLDEFVASVESANDAQRMEIIQMLETLSTNRLHRWLSWLREQEWTGRSLTLFLDFRLNYWEETPEWWVSSYSRYEHWGAYPKSYNALSLDATLTLVQARQNYDASEIIDATWLKDWEDLELWKLGFPSFASFAVFRASQNDGEDWYSHIIANTDFYTSQSILTLYRLSARGRSEPILAAMDERHRVWEEFLPYGNYWFAIQDWYDPNEWHDGLGWAIVSYEDSLSNMLGIKDMTEPYSEFPYHKST